MPNEDKGARWQRENLKLQEKSETFSDVTHAGQRRYQFEQVQAVKHLNIEMFKVHPCSNQSQHDHKKCVYFHTAKDRRRYGVVPMRVLCSALPKCREGDACPYSHSQVQIFYRVDSYKKWFCSHYPRSIKDCPYGDFCSFAHSQEEVLSPLLHNYNEDDDFYMFHYKTAFCPFNLTEHDKSKCVYAHNWQDYRRSPSSHWYEPLPCIHWKCQQYVAEYEEGCAEGVRCNMCHGWKEQQYHPSLYKTAKCEQIVCKKASCPKYHSEHERRMLPQCVQSSWFKLVPRNRIVAGVFKISEREGFKPKESFKSKTVIQNRKKEEDKTGTVVSTKPSITGERSDKWVGDKEIINSEDEDQGIQDLASKLGKLNQYIN